MYCFDSHPESSSHRREFDMTERLGLAQLGDFS